MNKGTEANTTIIAISSIENRSSLFLPIKNFFIGRQDMASWGELEESGVGSRESGVHSPQSSAWSPQSLFRRLP